MRFLLAVALASLVALGLAACGSSSDGGSWCPGTICTNCATDPACDVTCGQGKTPACVGGSYFGADPNARCGFCM